MTLVLVSLALAVPVVMLGLAAPKIIQQELAKLERFYPSLASRAPMTAEEIAVASGTIAPVRRFAVEAIESAADAGRIERRPPYPGENVLRYTVRRLRTWTSGH